MRPFGVPFYATIFTRDLEQTRQLIGLAEEKSRATVLTRVVVKEPIEDWKGFFIFEKRPKPHPFAFVVEHVISQEKSSETG